MATRAPAPHPGKALLRHPQGASPDQAGLNVLAPHPSSVDSGEAIKDANGYRDSEGNLCYVNDRDPQPLYHCERGDGEQPITSHYPLNTWFHSHDCEYLYVFETDKTWTVFSVNDPFDQ